MKLTDASQLDWDAARQAAEEILDQCEDAAYTAPEALEMHQRRITLVCRAMGCIVKALCITPPGGES